MKKRTGEPWIPAPAYGGLLAQFTVNLIVRDIARALRFYEEVLQAYVHYSDPDFAAVRVLGIELMLHADHAYEGNPWSARLKEGMLRGLGAELRLLGRGAYQQEFGRYRCKLSAVGAKCLQMAGFAR